MNIKVIGENAGIIWNLLNKKGSMSFSELKREAKMSNIDINLAIGWLAREGKLKNSDIYELV